MQNRYTTPHHKGITNAHQRRIKKRKQKRKVLIERPVHSHPIQWDDTWITPGFYTGHIQMLGRSSRGGGFFTHTIIELHGEKRKNPFEEIKR